MKLYIENIVTDLRKYGIKLSKELFDAMNEFADIQNSYVSKMDIQKWQDTKGKTILFVEDGQILAVYGDGRFMYNPYKLKISQAPEYDIYEVTVGGTNVQNRRQERRDYLQGLTRTKDSPYSNTPTSTNYIWDKDWNPEVNKRYYAKLLKRNNLKRYEGILSDAYDVVRDMIEQRKERLTGKRLEYDRMITDISRQIGKVEEEMIDIEMDFDASPERLEKELKKLPVYVKKAKEFMEMEEKGYKHWGKRKPKVLKPIEK